MTTENQIDLSYQPLKDGNQLNEKVASTSSKKNQDDIASNFFNDEQNYTDPLRSKKRESSKSFDECSRPENEDVFEENFVTESTRALRASHDTLNVELSDDNESDLSDDDSDDISDNLETICSCRMDSDISSQPWDKEYVWEREIKLQQRTIHPNEKTCRVIFQKNCRKLSKFSLTSAHQSALEISKWLVR